MKLTPSHLNSFFKRTTVRFISFYLLLILLPTCVFMSSYVSGLHKQARTEQRYEQETVLQQNVQAVADQLAQAELIVSTLQTNTPLLTLLEGRYLTASDELFAYVSYIKPLLDSIQMVNPLVTDLYIYRSNRSFIQNFGLVHSLCDIEDYAYPVRPESKTGSTGFLAAEPDQVRHRPDEAPDGPRYVYLANIYSQDYNDVVAIVELQLDIERLMFPALQLSKQDQLYLSWGEQCWPVRQSGRGFSLAEASVGFAPQPGEGESAAQATARDLTFTWIQPLRSPYAAGNASAVWPLLLVAVPLLLFCLYVYQFSRRITQFSTHIRQTERGLPVPYTGKIHNDEFGDMIREYNALTQLILEQVESIREAERLKNAASYYAMSSQVNPHFMFNTLESIRMHIELERYDEASQMLYTLGYFLRYNISMREESRLQDELDHIRHYLCIYQYRLNNVISYDIEEEEDLPNVRCPFSILQPIVENCLGHGIKGAKALLHIRVVVTKDEGCVRVDISDNGVGMAPEDLCALNERLAYATETREVGEHVGLNNVNARLRYYYGPGHDLSFSANPGGGVTCHIRLGLVPMHEEKA